MSSRLTVNLTSVLLTRGHDGLLRGKPEPVLLFAAYAVAGKYVALLSSIRHTFGVRGPYPSTVDCKQQALFRAPLPDGVQRVLLLCLALEYDRGPDILALGDGLSVPEHWGVWATDSPVEVPFSLADLALLQPFRPPSAMTVNVRFMERDCRELCQQDDFVGGAVILLSPQRPTRDTWRARMISADGRNDWTANLWVQL